MSKYHYIVRTGNPLIAPAYTIVDGQVPMTADQVVEKLNSLEEALHQGDHFVSFDEDGWSIEHLVECRPDMTKCEFHQRMISIGFDNSHRRGRYRVELKPLLDLEFTRVWR